jgi:hypothetical protein
VIRAILAILEPLALLVLPEHKVIPDLLDLD